jgi:hypothetical protein
MWLSLQRTVSFLLTPYPNVCVQLLGYYIIQYHTISYYICWVTTDLGLESSWVSHSVLAALFLSDTDV